MESNESFTCKQILIINLILILSFCKKNYRLFSFSISRDSLKVFNVIQIPPSQES